MRIAIPTTPTPISSTCRPRDCCRRSTEKREPRKSTRPARPSRSKPAIRCRTTPTWTSGSTGSRTSRTAGRRRDAPGSFVPSAGGLKDTTHIAVIDKDGNIFDSTQSGGWIGGGVILGTTGIGLSTRGEQFWLDEERANQLRPRARPRYTLTPSIVLRDGEPFMAIGTPGRRQPRSDHPANVPERRRVLVGLVPESARRHRVAPGPHAAFVRLVLAACRRLQSDGHRIDHLRRCGPGAATPGTPRQ